MMDEPICATVTGYLRVELLVKGVATTLWQRVEDGAVIGYLDAKAAPFVLPEVYEMRVLDSQMIPAL